MDLEIAFNREHCAGFCRRGLQRAEVVENLVGAEGFEPTTLCSQSRCATRLRYAPTHSIVTYPVLKAAIEERSC